MVPLLEIKDLCVYFPLKKGIFQREQPYVRAVDKVSLTLNSGETLALVGESGSGKTSLGRAVLKLVEIHSGSICYKGRDITRISSGQMLPFRREMQMIFQDPYSSLNPRMSISEIVGEALLEHKIFAKADSAYYSEISRILRLCGLEEDCLNLFPHQFSGGQRQRIGIARALVLQPSLLIADEAVSALDVSVKAQILQLLKNLQDRMGLSYLFITHDLSIVQNFASRAAVMYAGRIVELAPSGELFAHPLHPYTRRLLASAPLIRRASAAPQPAESPAPRSLPPHTGCSYAHLCPLMQGRCLNEQPPLIERGGRACACFFTE